MPNQISPYKPVFIIGAQRSGTTLLRLMMNAHSEIAIPEEGTFWMPLLRKFKGRLKEKINKHDLEKYFKYIQSNTQFNLWGIEPDKVFDNIRKKGICSLPELMAALYEYYAATAKKKYWGDKTPSFFRMIQVLSRLFPDARFIHMIRDGRDIYLSWRKMDSTKSNICVTALEWVYKVRKAHKELKQLDSKRVMEIRYEDFVENSEKELKKICGFIGLQYESNMLNYWQTSEQFIGNHHSSLIFKPVSSSSVNKWQKELTENEIMEFELIAGRLLSSMNYSLAQTNKQNIKLMVIVLLKLLYGLPLRAFQVLYTVFILNISSKLGWATDAAGKGDQSRKL